jgi:sugar phosphate isomerase/epimerase
MYDWAKEMGIEVLVTETTPNEVHDKLCQEYGIRFALHNHPATWPPNAVLKACKGKSESIGACADTGHWVRAQMNPVAMLRKLEGRIESLHFKDLNQYGNGHDVPWGTGVGDARAQIAELKRQGFKGYLSIEYEHGSVKDLLNNLPKCIQFFDKVTTELGE